MVSIPKLSKMRRPVKVYTFDEYLHREAQAAEKHEFYNRKIITMPGGTRIHSEISANVITYFVISRLQRRIPKNLFGQVTRRWFLMPFLVEITCLCCAHVVIRFLIKR
jgi:Uma2 family endonuclease